MLSQRGNVIEVRIIPLAEPWIDVLEPEDEVSNNYDSHDMREVEEQCIVSHLV